MNYSETCQERSEKTLLQSSIRKAITINFNNKWMLKCQQKCYKWSVYISLHHFKTSSVVLSF